MWSWATAIVIIGDLATLRHRFYDKQRMRRSQRSFSRDSHPRPRHPQCEGLGASFRVSPPVDAPSRLGFNCTHSVITALYGGYDTLVDYSKGFQRTLQREERERGFRTCWFAFTDAASVPSHRRIKAAEAAFNATAVRNQRWVQAGIWNLVILPEGQLTATLPERNKLRSRLPKMMAHCVMGYSSKMIYLDAKVILKQPGSIWRMLSQLSDGSGSAWVSPLHPVRSSVRDELVCLYLSGIVSERAFEQLREYHKVGFPSNLPASKGGPGLSEGEWHARDLQDANSTAIGNAWFSEWWRWGKYNLRDQISFNYVIWWLGLLPAKSGGSRGFSHYRGHIEQPRPRCCTPAWHRWAKARGNRSFITHNPHKIARTSLTTEDMFLTEHFHHLGPVQIADLKRAHRWCDLVTFGLDNTKLLNNLASLLRNSTEA